MFRRSVTAALLGVSLTALPAFADEQSNGARVEIDPSAPLRPGTPVVMKSPTLAALMTLALPLAATTPVFVLKPGTLSSGLPFATPVLAGVGDLYAGDPWRAFSVSLGGPLSVLTGWGIGMAYAQASGITDAASRASFGSNGVWWGYGIFLAWAAADAYVSTDLANKRALGRAGITE